MAAHTWEKSKQRKLAYLRRRAEETPLYRLLYQYRDEFEYRWEELFEARYGALRQEVLVAFDRYLNCGILAHGCARAHCEHCGHSILIAFSCKRRGLCPSCDSKRALLFAEHLHHNVLLPHRHRHVVFTLPKRLRVYFKFNRSLLRHVYAAAWRAWSQYVAEQLPEGKTAAVMALHPAGELLNWHPHIHALCLDGAIDDSGAFQPLSNPDSERLQTVFADCVFASLLGEELLTDEIVQNMQSWEHSGFSVWCAEPTEPENEQARLFLARYLKRSPVALERLAIDETTAEPQVVYTKHCDDIDQVREFSPLEFLAELQAHIPNIWEQTTRYFGQYSPRVRGELKKQNDTAACREPSAGILPLPEQDTQQPASQHWAACIKRVFEVDPLVCTRCGGEMKIAAFIHDLKQINRICKNLGIQPWRAPPKITGAQLQFEQILVPVFE